MKTALIGLGRIGWYYHLKQILSHEGFDLCAVVDTSTQRLEEAKELCGAAGYTDYRQMLSEAKPELVVIASPTSFHKEHAITAMEAGAHVLLDKPMALDYTEACAIADAHRKTGRKLIIYQPHRFSSAALAAKAILASGKLGTPYLLRTTDQNYARRNDWQAFRKFGGGMLSNYGAHYIDQLLHLSQSKVVDYHCFAQRILSMGDADDVAHILMRTENGMTLDVNINQATSLPDAPMKLCGTNGSAVYTIDPNGDYFLLKYCDPATLEEKTVNADLAAADRRYPNDKVQWITERIPLSDYPEADFYAACAPYFFEDAPSPIPVEETLRVMELINLCYQQNEHSLR